MSRLEFSFCARRGEAVLKAEGQFRFGLGAWVQAVMGESGSGKTTFARWIAGLEPAPGSRLRWNEEVWEGEGSLRPSHLRGLALLAQHDALFPHLTLAENVGYALARQPLRERRQRVETLLAMVGLPKAGPRRPASLSGGEKRRVALAQALAARPRLLLLDEPFTGLDEAAKRNLWADTRRWIEEASLPTILITHDPREAEAFGAPISRYERRSLFIPDPLVGG